MDAKNYIITQPNLIEGESFRIIENELGLSSFPPEYAAIIKRVIHTTADFEYGRLIDIHPKAIESAAAAIKDGCWIYADTRMIEAGVNKRKLAQWESMVYTYIDHPEVANQADARKVTRSIVGIEKAVCDENTSIYVVGNAPTALVRLCELIDEGKVNPSLVVGVPVGFVGAAESKEFLRTKNVPYIITRGNKGGSTVAVAIINAIIYGLV
jgi:precorrin-8X/cobalt-precorrin-8 methylmutase